VLSALHRRNHLPVPPGPCTQPMLPRGHSVVSIFRASEYTSRLIVTVAPQHTALGVHAWISYDFEAIDVAER
jgi:hypothetical protein